MISVPFFGNAFQHNRIYYPIKRGFRQVIRRKMPICTNFPCHCSETVDYSQKNNAAAQAHCRGSQIRQQALSFLAHI
jgi:hypothetical protein